MAYQVPSQRWTGVTGDRNLRRTRRSTSKYNENIKSACADLMTRYRVGRALEG
jgi:hypothetical protein